MAQEPRGPADPPCGTCPLPPPSAPGPRSAGRQAARPAGIAAALRPSRKAAGEPASIEAGGRRPARSVRTCRAAVRPQVEQPANLDGLRAPSRLRRGLGPMATFRPQVHQTWSIVVAPVWHLVVGTEGYSGVLTCLWRPQKRGWASGPWHFKSPAYANFATPPTTFDAGACSLSLAGVPHHPRAAPTLRRRSSTASAKFRLGRAHKDPRAGNPRGGAGLAARDAILVE